jgi:hypothetical protein
MEYSELCYLYYEILKLSALAVGAPRQTLHEEPRPYRAPQTPSWLRGDGKERGRKGKGENKRTGEEGVYNFSNCECNQV